MARILYLIPGRMDERERAQREVAAGKMLMDPSNQIELITCEDGPDSVESAVEEMMSVSGLIKRYVSLDTRYDAMIIGCAGDPGQFALREIADIPVIGPLQSSLAVATTLGHSFGVVSILEQMDPATEMQIRGLGYENMLAGVEHINCNVLDMAEGRVPEGELTDAVLKAGKDLMKKGAASIVLGCMTLAFLLMDEKLKDILPIPVVNPAKIAIGMAEILIKSGLGHSKITYPTPDLDKLKNSILPELAASSSLDHNCN
jgi:allantoin racemase